MKWNYCAIVCAPPEYGKTTVLHRIVRRHLGVGDYASDPASPRGVALVHDPKGQFSRDGCYLYKDAAAYKRRGLALAKEGKVMPRGASLGGSSSQLIALGREIGRRAGNTQDNVRVPVLVALDEGSASDSSGSTWISQEDQEALALRRHEGNGYVFNIQTPTMLMERFYLLATDFYLFVCTSKHARLLDERLVLEPGTLERAGITTLPPYRYLHCRRVVGVVPEEL